MAESNNSVPSRDELISENLEYLRRQLWQADGIVRIAHNVLMRGGSPINGSIDDGTADSIATALLAASEIIGRATGKMEGEVFLQEIDQAGREFKEQLGGAQP